MTENYEIDNTDLEILELLINNAKKPYTEVAKRTFVSPGTVHVRMAKLEKEGIVTGSTLDIDATKLGFDIMAFIGIYLEKSSLYDEVFTQLKKITEITNIYYTTGNYSMFVKIYCRDTSHLKEVLHDKIQRVKGIARTDTILSLEESLKRHIHLKSEQ